MSTGTYSISMLNLWCTIIIC